MKKFFLIIAGISLLGLFLSFNFQINEIAGDFMSPTFEQGNNLLFKKYFLGTPSPNRADVVVYKKTDDPSVDYVGRVIAMPLEEVRVENGNVYIKTDKPMKMIEDYLPKGTKTHATPEGEWIKFKEFQYLVVSDNRNNRTINLLKDNLVNRYQIKGYFIYKF